MHAEIVREIFRRGKRHFRRGDAFDRGIVRKVGKKHRAGDRARSLEILHEIIGFLVSYPYCRKHHGEFFIAFQHARLPRDLRGKLCVRQPAHTENGQFLTAHEGI